MNQERFTFKKDEILSKRDDINRLFKESSSFTIYPFKVLYRSYPSENDSNLQAGFSIPKRLYKKAVDRNLLKRRCKEAYRRNKNDLKQTLTENHSALHLLLIYIAKEPQEYSQIEQKIILTLQRLQLIYAEDT